MVDGSPSLELSGSCALGVGGIRDHHPGFVTGLQGIPPPLGSADLGLPSPPPPPQLLSPILLYVTLPDYLKPNPSQL